MAKSLVGAARKPNELKFREFKPDFPAVRCDPWIRCFLAQNKRGETFTVFVSNRPANRGGWHISIAHPDRYPTWDEISECRYRLVPGTVTMAMILPPRNQYVNLHENCFHLHQISNKPEIADDEAPDIPTRGEGSE